MLKLFNTLSRKIEEFKPINPPNVGVYICGPTVYDYMHIGNLRTFLMGDLLLRVLEANNYKVKFIQNITDIDDKIIKRASEKGVSIHELVKNYADLYFQDLKKLNIKPADVYPKATEHINGMIQLTQGLIDKGLAYIEKDGSVYFDISKFAGYGKLSKLDKRELKTGTRTLSDNYTKDDVSDFALWKVVNPNEVGFDSPWGRGRPGWHIECSVMSQKYLGDTLDIHGGGVDLIFPHHENEIAQSEGLTGKTFSNIFLHGEHMLVEGQKMSKSLGNFLTLKNLEEKGFDPLAFRYLILTAHYRDKLNFTWKSLQAAQNALNRLREEIRLWEQPKGQLGHFWHQFLEAANNDLNMPQAVAVMWEMVHNKLGSSTKSIDLLEMDKILGLKLNEYLGQRLKVPDDVKELIEVREKARVNQDFKIADKLRDQIKKQGFDIEDTPTGPKVKLLNLSEQ